MTLEYTTRTDARTVPCPLCHAAPGQLCIGARDKLRASVHAERHLVYLNANRQHESRYYDQPPAEIPIAYQHDEPVRAPGRVIVPIPEPARALGLREVQRCRAILDQHGRTSKTYRP